ncbi:MAG: glycosyltransferase family 2 protein [Longimicrobiales bacterium]
MATAVIISTYNQPAWLEKVLWGYALQSTTTFDVVVADDGSDERTRTVVEAARAFFGERLVHVWQEDQGFRKCEILNKAIVAAQADYLIFTDGDCIPRRDFVQRHIELAGPGHFLSGGVVWLPRPLSEQVTRADIEQNRLSEPDWLRRRGWPGGRQLLRLVRPGAWATLLDRLTPTRATFNGHNASVTREALMAVNGFDAEMGYGGLDRALGERLYNLGLRGLGVRHRAVCFHLDHDRPYRKPEVVRKNREIRARIRRTGELRARLGIAEVTTATGTKA